MTAWHNTGAHKLVSSNSNCGARRSGLCVLSIRCEITNCFSDIPFRNDSRCDFISWICYNSVPLGQNEFNFAWILKLTAGSDRSTYKLSRLSWGYWSSLLHSCSSTTCWWIILIAVSFRESNMIHFHWAKLNSISLQTYDD
jgi:hypothetical protein